MERPDMLLLIGSVPDPQWGLAWTYDRYGNRTAQSRTHGTVAPTNSVSVSTSTNQITAMSGFTFYYDANGNLTQDDLYKYKYDAENRMVELRLANNTLVSTYAFDGNSLRVIKVWGANRTWYLYAGSQLVSEYWDAASATYSAGTNAGTASDSGATQLYQHADHLTTRLTTDNSNDTGNEQRHYPYGEVLQATGTADPSVLRKFTTYMKDEEASAGALNYAVFREHSARIGRFNMADPVQSNVRNPQRLNLYSYALANPVNNTDPLGLDVIQTRGSRRGGGPSTEPLISAAMTNWEIEMRLLGSPAGKTNISSGGRDASFADTPQECANAYANCLRQADSAFRTCLEASKIAVVSCPILCGIRCGRFVVMPTLAAYCFAECILVCEAAVAVHYGMCYSVLYSSQDSCQTYYTLCMARASK